MVFYWSKYYIYVTMVYVIEYVPLTFFANTLTLTLTQLINARQTGSLFIQKENLILSPSSKKLMNL